MRVVLGVIGIKTAYPVVDLVGDGGSTAVDEGGAAGFCIIDDSQAVVEVFGVGVLGLD